MKEIFTYRGIEVARPDGPFIDTSALWQDLTPSKKPSLFRRFLNFLKQLSNGK